MRSCILLDFNYCGLYRFCYCFEVALDGCNSLNDDAKVGGILELGNKDAYSYNHSLDKRLRH
jgi:hypothetical protein